MTPEQKLDDLFATTEIYPSFRYVDPVTKKRLCDAAAEIIREAERLAYERAAKVAQEKFADPGWHAMAKMAGHSIALSIHALSQPGAQAEKTEGT
jgi:hypothetical protein